jgi:hypothetical protein
MQTQGTSNHNQGQKSHKSLWQYPHECFLFWQNLENFQAKMG